MRYLTSNTYVSPTKDQIRVALTKVTKAYQEYKPIVYRLENTEVIVKKWFGLSKKTMTMDQHIQQEGKRSFIPYHMRALMLGYITLKEFSVCEYVMDSPTLNKLKEWYESDQVFLGEFDHDELMYALTKEY